MLNKKRTLTAAVLLSCSCFMLPYYAHAKEEIPDCGHEATYMTITAGDQPYIFDIYNATTHPGQHWLGEFKQDDNEEYILDENGNKIKVYVSYRDFYDGETKAFADSIGYIHTMFNPINAYVPTLKLELLPDQDANASAGSETYIQTNANGKPIFQISDTELGAVLLGKYEPQAGKVVAEININMSNPGTSWYIDKFPVLPDNGVNSDYYGTVVHEMFHALGMGASVSDGNSVTFGKFVNYKEEGFSKAQKVFNKYEIGLRDAFGRVGYYSLEGNNYHYYDNNPINPNDPNSLNTIRGELMSRNIVSISVEEYNELLHNSNSIDAQSFYILRDPVSNTGDSEEESLDRHANQNSTISSAPTAEITEINQNGGVYFTGANVKDVLTTGSSIAKIAWPDGSTVPAVEGLPVNCYEDSDETTPELSHIELQNALMSHQAYRNWCSFMEAELALMQDLGYDIDRGAYFGKSIYNSGLTYENTQGFFKRVQQSNGSWEYRENEPSTQMHGIGLHIYGSNNDITQTGKILTKGYSGIGIRVDGVENKLTINTDITADGAYGNGLLVAYGKEHKVTLNTGKTIQALGKDGVAARFDFGSNELGDQAEYRGSYIKTSYTSQEALEEIKKKNPLVAENMKVGWKDFTSADLPEAIKGDLVTDFNVNGTLKGKLASIYISPNALVKNININAGAQLEGNIISLWNPDAILYQNNDGNIITPALPEGEDGLTNLNFKGTHTFNNRILGQEGIRLNVENGATLTTTDLINVKEVNIKYNSTYNNHGLLTADGGAGVINIDGILDNNNGRIFSRVNDDGALLSINGDGTLKLDNAKIQLGMMHDFYDGNVVLRANWANTLIISVTPQINLFEQSPTLDFEGSLDPATHEYTIKMRRNYEQFAYDEGTNGLAKALQQNAAYLGNESSHAEAWQKLYEAIDFSKADGSQVANALKQLNPSVFSNSAQITLNTHSSLNNMNMLGSFSSNIPAARTVGGRGPAIEVIPQYNSWRNIVTPFSAYTDQHRGMRGYTNHNSGVIGAMERTLENGLTHGYHAAVNHQSTSEAGSSVKGEGFYLGAQASYAPAKWNDWSVFGSARLGLEQMRSHRSVSLPGDSSGSANADWTGYSGSLSLGTALTRAHGVLQSGPFAALDYSFAHRPSVNENGDLISTHLASTTYDSLRTQLGYRLTTKPKALDSYDSTKWQAHASVAWNHELLGDNGSTSYSFTDLPGVVISDTTEIYGRDSLSLAAGLTFKTPQRLDVGLTLGSDIYRKGGSSVYGKVNLEWKF